MSLVDRVVQTNISSIRGYVRRTRPGEFFWVLKDFEPNGQKFVSPYFMSWGYEDSSHKAFHALYREVHYYTLEVVKEKNEEGED